MDQVKTTDPHLQEFDFASKDSKRQREEQALQAFSGPRAVQADAASLFGQGLTKEFSSNEILMEGQHEVWNEEAADQLSVDFTTNDAMMDGPKEADDEW